MLAKITRIITQKRNKHRYNIFINDGHGEKYGFSVDEEVLIEFHLRKGLELDADLQVKLLERDTLQQSYTKVIGYLSYRMRTKQEVYDYLVKNDVDDEHITLIIEKLIKRKLLNDKEFAQAFVNTRIQTTHKGPGIIKQELIKKGVRATIADEAVVAMDQNLQREKAMNIVEKRLKKSSKHSHRKQMQTIQANLMRNGFSNDVIQDVIADASIKDKDEEWEALAYQGNRLFQRHHQKFSGYDLHNKIKEGLYRQGFDITQIDVFLNTLEA